MQRTHAGQLHIDLVRAHWAEGNQSQAVFSIASKSIHHTQAAASLGSNWGLLSTHTR